MEESYQRYIDGDDSGIVEIIKSYREGLILYTYGFTNNIFTAEEIVDDVFFKLMVKKPMAFALEYSPYLFSAHVMYPCP